MSPPIAGRCDGLGHRGPSHRGGLSGLACLGGEACTIVLVVARLRGWRSAVLGKAAGLTVLGAIVLILGPFLDRVPLGV